LLRRTCILKIREVFTDFIITGYNFHFTLCLWRQIQNVGLTVEYKETEQVRLTCRIVLFWHTCFWIKQEKFGFWSWKYTTEW
jgi:hypothetical protein